jgi:hypothetical protein
MAHRIIRIGSKLDAVVDLDSNRTSWPDRDLAFDVAGVRIENSGTVLTLAKETLGGRLRAVALAYDTDWDFVRVGAPSGDARVLGPGAVVDLSDLDIKQLSITPHFNVPSTRLYNAQMLQKFQGQKPDHAPGWTVIVATGQFRNDTGKAAPVYVFDPAQGAWSFYENIAAGGVATYPRAAANDAPLEDSRACDWSPDQEWNFADYMEAGFIVGDNGSSQKNVAYIGYGALDSRGQPGSNGLATAVKYALGSNQFADLSPQFYGKLSLELWTDDDCPPHGYRPRLAPVRYVSLAAIAHAGGAAAPNKAIVTVPASNIERAQYLMRNAGPGNIFAQLVQPRAEDWIDQVTGVADVDPASGATFSTIAAGADAALFLEEPSGPFIKLNIGADGGGGATIAARSVLSLVRRET